MYSQHKEMNELKQPTASTHACTLPANTAQIITIDPATYNNPSNTIIQKRQPKRTVRDTHKMTFWVPSKRSL